jgi:hypothetical protein
MTALTLEMIQKLELSFSPHPAYIQILPHLITIFWAAQRCITWIPICELLRGQGECAYAASPAIKSIIFTDGIRKLMDQRNICVEKLEDYIKKMAVYFFLCTFCGIKKIINCPNFLNSPHTKHLPKLLEVLVIWLCCCRLFIFIFQYQQLISCAEFVILTIRKK